MMRSARRRSCQTAASFGKTVMRGAIAGWPDLTIGDINRPAAFPDSRTPGIGAALAFARLFAFHGGDSLAQGIVDAILPARTIFLKMLQNGAIQTQ